MPVSAPRFTAARLCAAWVLLMSFHVAHAHSVPSLTVEAIFQPDRSYLLRVNVDPRLFLSATPTSLPPIEAGWYRGQTPDQLKATEKQAREYLTAALAPSFSSTTTSLPDATFQAMDGATNLPLSPESKEVHLLAEMHGQAPAGATDFALSLGKAANASMILINSLGEKQERRPQVIFPGETSRPFQLPAISSVTPSVSAPTPAPAPPAQMPVSASPGSKVEMVTQGEIQEVSREGPLIVVLCAGLAVALVVLGRKWLKH